MSTPALPAYLGSWSDLLNALLHNPSLGGGRGNRPHVTHWDPEILMSRGGEFDSNPMPGFVASIIGLVSLKDAALRIKNEALVGQIEGSIADEVDGICPPFRPHPWPGPPWPILAGVATLVYIANTFQEGNVQAGLNKVASQLLERALQSNRG